jgi:hypothetical protein
VIVITDEDAAVIAVKSQWHTVAAQPLAKQAEVAKSPFEEKKLGGQNFTAGIVLHTQSGEPRESCTIFSRTASGKRRRLGRPRLA